MPLKKTCLLAGAILTLWAFPAQAADHAENDTAPPFAAMGVAPVTPPTVAEIFSLPDLAEGEINLTDYAGKVVILNFWATWCIPCREEMPHLESLWKQYRDQGLVVLAVSEDKGRSKRVKKFISKRGFSFPVALDRKGRVGRAYRVSGLPASVLIDRRGRAVGRVVGYRDWDGEDAQTLVKSLLGTTD